MFSMQFVLQNIWGGPPFTVQNEAEPTSRFLYVQDSSFTKLVLTLSYNFFGFEQMYATSALGSIL